MTSKNLFFKRMKQDLEQRIWLPVVFFILGFLMTEMPLISRLNTWQNRTDFVSRMQDYLLEDFFTPNSVFTVMSVCVALVSALSGFVYIHSAKKLDVYHSLPVKRETLFFQQYLCGILYYVVPMMVHVLLCLIICGGNGVLTGVVLGNALGFALVQLLMYLVCYSLVVVAVCLTGNLVISVLGSVILLTYTWLIYWLVNGLMNTFFVTFYGPEAGVGVPALSPVHMIYNMLVDMNESYVDYLVYTDYPGHYGVMFLGIVIFTALALFLYKKRPTEMAGSTMVFPITEPVVKAMVVIPTSIVSGYLFTAIISNSGDFVWYMVGCIFGYIIICPLMEIIFRKDMKAILAHPLQLIFNGVCVIGLLLILEFDLLGYDRYIPEEDRVESYALDFNGISTVRSGYGDISHMYRLENMEIKDNDSTRKLLEHAAEFSRPLRKGELAEEVANGEVRSTYLDVRYNLKNGKTIYRSYLINIQDAQVMQWLEDTYNDMQHKLAVYPVLSEGREENYIGVIAETAFSTDELPLSEEKMQRLVETYRRDLTNLSFEEIFTQYPIADLTFVLKDPGEEVVRATEYTTVTEERVAMSYIMESGFGSYAEEYGYRIYPSFTQTIALLKEYGADFATVLPAEDIVEIRINDYTREVNDNDGLYNKVVKKLYTAGNGDYVKIEEILPNLIPGKFVEGFQSDSNAEPNMEVDMTYRYDDIEMSTYFSFKKDQIPQFVVEDLEKAYLEMEEAAQ